jgi:hypothetical protein
MPEQTEQIVAKMLDIPIVKKAPPKIQQDGSMTGTYSFTPAQTEFYHRVELKMSHVNPNPQFEEVFEYLAKNFLSPEIKKERRAAKKVAISEVRPATGLESETQPLRKPNSAEDEPRPYKDPAYISPQVRREIEQEQPSCRWLYPDGTMCESEFQLQIDHIKSIWAGGDSRKSNLQRLCGIHNRKKYRLEANIHPH